jgi:hypothetical protein
MSKNTVKPGLHVSTAAGGEHRVDAFARHVAASDVDAIAALVGLSSEVDAVTRWRLRHAQQSLLLFVVGDRRPVRHHPAGRANPLRRPPRPRRHVALCKCPDGQTEGLQRAFPLVRGLFAHPEVTGCTT